MQILVVVANIQAKPSKAEVEKGSTRTSIERGVAAPEGGGERRDTAGTSASKGARGPWPTERESGIDSRASTRRFAFGPARAVGSGPGGDANTPGDDDSGAREELSFLGKVARSTSTAESRRAEKRWAARPKSDVRAGRRPVPPSRPVKIRASAVESRASAYRTTAAGLRGE